MKESHYSKNHRVLLACPENSEFQQARSEVKAYTHAEVQSVSDQKLFAETMEEFEPEAVVLDQNFLEINAIKKIRENHPRKAFVFIGQPEAMENAFSKGINVFLTNNETHRIRPWLDLLFALKKPDLDAQIKARNRIWAAKPPPADAIYSPALDALREELQMSAKADQDREKALRNWTQEIEQKKNSGGVSTSSKSAREDLLITQSESEMPAPRDTTPDEKSSEMSSETILKELRKIQSELTQRLDALNTEVRELSAREKERLASK